jgi:hypothetical protein
MPGVPNVGDIVTTTIENRSKSLADSVSKSNVLLARLESKGRRRTFDGGTKIDQEIEYGENGTFGWYSGYDPLNIAPSETFTLAEYDIKQASVAVSISGLEELKNSGQERMIDLLEKRIENAEKTMKNQMGAAVYGDGTAAGGKAIGGLSLLVPDAPTVGTVGGINRANWTFWRSQKYGGVADGGGAVSTANIGLYMARLYMLLSRGTDHPDLIVSDNSYYLLYWQSLTPNQRFTNPQLAEQGFQNLKFQGADVTFDGGMDVICPVAHMFFLNTDYIYMRPHKDRQYTALGADRFATNQDAMVKLMGWAGNMTTSGSKFQGVLIA